MKNKDIFKDIIGYDNIKLELIRLIDILNNEDKYKSLGCTIPHGLLLYGDPGLGKTTFCNILLKNTNRSKYTIRKTKSNGSFLEYMTNIFKEAKMNQPSIILLDDLDKYAEDDNTRNSEEFVAIQSLIDEYRNDNIFIIATSNSIYNIPKSLLRSGRFDIKLEILLPKEEEAYEILKHYLSYKKIDKSVNLKNISYILGSVSCADLEKVSNKAAIYAAYNKKESISNEELIIASLEHTYDTNISSLYEVNDYSLEVAYHEAAHAIVGNILEPGSVSFITVVSTDSNTNGYTSYKENKNYWYDIKYMNNRIITLLAGKAASEIIFNKCDVGATSDIERAFNVAERIVDDYCAFDFYSCENRNSSNILLSHKENNISNLIDKSYREAKRILIENKDKLIKLSNILDKKKILFCDEINEILNKN